jgi:hypothetical protein
MSDGHLVLYTGSEMESFAAMAGLLRFPKTAKRMYQ